MMSSLLFSPCTLGALSLQNRVVMAPMTRSRAHNGVPTDIMATYYAQRASAGLLITEGTAPAPEGLGYARIPGLYNAEQVAGWRAVTDAVHAEGGRIFVQLMHVGRVGHPANLPAGARLLAPSAVAAPGTMWTDTLGPQPHPVPEEMTEADIEGAIAAFVHSARLAIEAGFDGVELHGANGYLLEQFANAATNQRTDRWGHGSLEDRSRFVVAVARATAEAIGKERVGIRLSPYGVFNGTANDPQTDAFFTHLAGELGALGLVYLHIVDHSAMGAPPVPEALQVAMGAAFGGPVIRVGGYNRDRAEADLQAGKAALVAFGRPFIANPRLVAALREGRTLRAPAFETFYSPGPAGYTDYPLDSEG
jgi:N-ethylmaleimide reductase